MVPKLVKSDRYQVILEKKDGTTEPYGPVADSQFCQRVAEGINRGLIRGKRSPLNITGAAVQRVALLS